MGLWDHALLGSRNILMYASGWDVSFLYERENVVLKSSHANWCFFSIIV